MLIDLHNYFRAEKGLEPFIASDILDYYAEKDARWMARRRWANYWNFLKREQELSNQFEYNFINISYNIAVGDTEDIVMKHILNDRERSSVLYGDFKNFGSGFYVTNYCYWVMLYGN